MKLKTFQLACQTEACDCMTDEQRARLEHAMKYIQKHFRKAPRLTEVAGKVGLSPFHFHRLFHECAGKTFKEIVTGLQIDEAKRLLLEGMTGREVTRQLSFANQSHFTSRFKQSTGLTPIAWLKERPARSQPVVTAECDEVSSDLHAVAS